ncbi:MAG: YebC/PmpR family DNA-binding transcriptional regulator [Clostridia bacterium]|nr:YebC/PmpR family DNA-binding transcriptional regulator [Clostridia bacterium]
MGRHGTIAGRKASQDSKRAALFTKYAKAVTLAAKNGGDPDYNPALRLAIEKAKSISMPNDNIKRAIMKGTGELGGETLTELTFEGYGASGVAVIVEAVTDNTNRTTSAVRSCMDKYGGNLGTPGCVSYMFSTKGVLVVEKEDGMDEDTVLEDALNAGADDMVTTEDSFEIYTEPSTFAEVHKNLTDAGYTFISAEVEKIPSMETEPKPEDLKNLKKMIEVLEDNEDVQNVYTNSKVDLYED